jgi:hypothetical protein
MARGVISYSSGTIAAAVSGVRYAFLNIIRSTLKAYISNGEAAWEDYDIISNTPGSCNYVMHSVGDRALGSGVTKGDSEIYNRFYESSNSQFFVNLQDWSQVGHAGNRASAAASISLNDTDALEWWMVCNEYVWLIAAHQSGSWFTACGGQLTRPYAPTMNGLARLSVATAGTGILTLSVDRDCQTTLRVGQKVILMNFTPDGQALKSAYYDLVTILAVTSGTIQVSGVTNTPYEIGSIIGIEPSPNYAGAATGSAPTSLYMSNLRDGSATIVAQSLTAYGSFVEADEDPGFDGAYIAVPTWLNGTSPAGFRGDFGEHALCFANGLQADKDIMRMDYDDARKYKIFPSLSFLSTWILGIGPGAS